MILHVIMAVPRGGYVVEQGALCLLCVRVCVCVVKREVGGE